MELPKPADVAQQAYGPQSVNGERCDSCISGALSSVERCGFITWSQVSISRPTAGPSLKACVAATKFPTDIIPRKPCLCEDWAGRKLELCQDVSLATVVYDVQVSNRGHHPLFHHLLMFGRPSGQAAPTAPASSAFAGMATAKPGFVFGVGAAVQPPTNSFSIGSGSAPKVAAAPGGFSFLNNAPAASPAAGSKALASAQPAALDPQRVSPSTPQGAPSSTAVAPGRQGGAFGEGRTAARGGRLNERFTSWLSHQLSEDAASFLDSGLRDYVTFAAEIRERADFSRPEPVPTTAFDHPSETIASTSASQAMPKPSETGTSPAASIPEPPPAAAAPAPAPSPVVKPAPTFTFSAPSSLPAAPPGPQFSFTLPSAATTSATSEEQTAVASSPPSSLGGFKFNAGGFGAAGVSHGAFNGEIAIAIDGFCMFRKNSVQHRL